MVRLKNAVVNSYNSLNCISKCFNQCSTMKRRLHFRRCIDKTYKKLVKLNLSNIFNSTIVKPIKYIKNEFQNTYKDKIKSEYHYTPKTGTRSPLSNITNIQQPDILSNNSNETTASATKKCIELSFNYMQSPTLRDKIEEIFETMISHNKSALTHTDSIDLSDHQIHYLDNDYRIINMSAGRYLHIGIASQIRKYMNQTVSPSQQLNLTIGMYVMKSTTSTGLNIPRYLAIFGRISDSYDTAMPTKKKSFIIGIYQGTFPIPTIANEILRPFVDEMKEITTTQHAQKQIHQLQQQQQHRHQHNGIDTTYASSSSVAAALLPANIIFHSIVVDPIANSLITCTSLPNGLFGCSKCRQKGQLQFNHGLTSFPPYCKSENLRFDEDFKYCLDRNYHFGVPIMTELNVGLVSQIVIDYRNTIVFGVMRRLMDLWLTGKLDYRLNKEAIRKIDCELSKIKCPKEFEQPTPKTLNVRAEWTAYDWRQFLLYYGPIVLKGNLPNKFYLNFLLLHMSVRVMINPAEHNKCTAFISGILLKKFLIEFALLYGEDLVDYNLHNLLHYEEAINRYGTLEIVGGFSFENQIDFMQNSVIAKDDIKLEDVAEMLSGQSSNSTVSPLPVEGRGSGGTTYLDEKYNLFWKSFLLNNSEPNNYVLTKRGAVKICGIYIDDKTNEICIIGQKFRNNLVLYEVPITDQNLTLVTGLNEFEMFKLSEIITKAMAFETACGVYIMPVLFQ